MSEFSRRILFSNGLSHSYLCPDFAFENVVSESILSVA